MIGSKEVIVKPLNPVSPDGIGHTDAGAGGRGGNP
jgi:hypothetical protein